MTVWSDIGGCPHPCLMGKTWDEDANARGEMNKSSGPVLWW